MSEVAYRTARVNDADAIRACIRQAYSDARRLIKDLPDVTAGIAEDIEARTSVVAEDGTGILGVIFFDQVEDAIMVFNLAVAPSAQGRGIARSLLQFAGTSAREQGLNRLKLRTHRELKATVAMYVHLGWEVTEQSGNKLTMQTDLPG